METAAAPSVRKRRRGAEIGARIAYAGHGLAYGLIAVFALDAAFGGGGEEAKGGKEALSAIAQTGWGTALLAVLAFGLLCYGVMRLWQAIANPSNHGNDAKGIGVRIGRVGSGVMQLTLAFFAASLAFGWFAGGGGGGGGGEGVTDLTARVMSWPAGRWIIGAVGAGIAIASFRQLARAVSADFMNELEPAAQRKEWIKPTGRAGFAARFVVFAIVGGFLIVAAVQHDAGEARGLGGALRTLQQQAYGPWLLGIVALGLLAFAVTRGIYARYQMIPQRD